MKNNYRAVDSVKMKVLHQKLLFSFLVLMIFFASRTVFASPLVLNYPGHARSAAGNIPGLSGISELMFNPAAVSLNSNSVSWEATGGIYELPLDTRNFHLAYTGSHLLPGKLGIGLSHFNAGSFEIIEQDGSAAGNAAVNASQFFLHYSNEIFKNINAGVNLKYYRAELAGFQSDSFLFDMSAMYRRQFSFATVYGALLVRNAGRNVQFDVESEPLPTEYSAGTGASFRFAENWHIKPGVYITASADYLSLEPGMEVSYEMGKNSISLRTSYRHQNALQLMRYGAGGVIDYNLYNVDFSVMAEPNRIDGVNYLFSVTFRQNHETAQIENIPESDARRAERFAKYIDNNSIQLTDDNLAYWLDRAEVDLKLKLNPEDGRYAVAKISNSVKLIYLSSNMNISIHTVITVEGSRFQGVIEKIDSKMLTLVVGENKLTIPVSRVSEIQDDYTDF